MNEEQITDPDANGLYNRDGNPFTDALIDHIEQQQLLNNKNTNVMNEKNLDYLKDNLKYMGFADKLNDQLEKNIKEGKPEFRLSLNENMYQGKMEANLHFKKSTSTDMYFFNSYQAHLTKDNGFDRSQQFYMDKGGKGVTLKEAYNLLEGRSVLKDLTNKEGEQYKAWIKLDTTGKENNQYPVKQYHAEKYGYDLPKELGKLSLAPLPEEKEKQLLQSLQKGNLQSVNFTKDGKESPMFIEANPQFKAVNVYNPSGHQLNKMEKEPYLKQATPSLASEPAPQLKKEDALPKEKIAGPEKKSEAATTTSKKTVKELMPQKEGSNKKALRV